MKFVAIFLFLTLAVTATACSGDTNSDDKNGQRRTLVRNGPYYEIVGDGDDFGNYFETYVVPTPYGDAYCIIYTDKIGDSGGGAAGNCWMVKDLQ